MYFKPRTPRGKNQASQARKQRSIRSEPKETSQALCMETKGAVGYFLYFFVIDYFFANTCRATARNIQYIRIMFDYLNNALNVLDSLSFAESRNMFKSRSPRGQESRMDEENHKYRAYRIKISIIYANKRCCWIFPLFLSY